MPPRKRLTEAPPTRGIHPRSRPDSPCHQDISGQSITLITETLPVQIALVDRQGNIVALNPGGTPSTLSRVFKGNNFEVGKNYILACEKASGTCAGEAKAVGRALRSVLAGHRDSFVLEYRCRVKKEPHWFQVVITPLSDDHQQGALVMHVDITPHRQVQEELKNRKQLLSVLMQNLPGMAYRCRNNRDWTMEFVSEGALTLTGYEPREFLGNKPVSYGRQIINPADRDRIWKETQSALKRRQPYQYTYRILTADGRVKWVWEQGRGIYSPNGKVVALEGFITDITQQKQAEEARRESEERLKLALMGGRLGTWDWNMPSDKIHVNARWVNMLGYTQEELAPTIGEWKNLIHPEDKARVMKVWHAHVAGYLPYFQSEYRLRTKSGKWKWVLNTGKIVERDRQGRPLRATGIQKDISERKAVEEELQKEREFMDAILETTGALVIVLDRQGRIVRFNHACEELTGWRAKEVVGQSIWKLNLIPSSEVKDVKRVFRSLLTEKAKKNRFENHWIGKNQSERLITWANTVIKSEDHKVEYVIGTGIDITEKKQAEMALLESQVRFQAFMDHTPTVAFLKDGEGRYVYVNQPFERKFGRSQAECLGKTDRELFPPEVAQVFRETDVQALRYGKVLESEETTLDAKGRLRHWIVLKFPIRDAHNRELIGGIGLDITQRKEAEQVIQQREAQLRQSQEELKALGRRLMNAQEEERRRISRELHDEMNQRLAVLALTIQSTQQRVSESDPLYAILQQQYDEVSKISDDIRRLAYQLHPSVLDDLGLKIALQSFVQDFSQWAHIRASFRAYDLPDSIPADVSACLYRLTQESLRNVARHAQASQVTVELSSQDGGLRLSIIDNGKGFDVKAARADRRGLGLIGMQERVSAINGTLNIHAIPGNGTQIVAWVPLSPEGKA